MMPAKISQLGETQMPPIPDRDYWRRWMETLRIPFFGNDIPPVETVFDLKSGARAKLIDRSGSMVIVEIEGYRSDWIEWREVQARIAAK
jgi:hypothetical protein